MSTFDEKAASWDQNPMRIERAAAVAATIRARVPLTAATEALEYGCGTGLLSFALLQSGPIGQITLADNSDGMLSVLRDKIRAAAISNLQPLYLDLASGPLPAQRFDLIFTLLTLHHIPEPMPILAAFSRLLRPGGWLAFADLDSEDGSFHDQPFDGHLGFARTAIHAELAGLGFTRIQFDTPYTITKTRPDKVRSYTIFLSTALKGGGSRQA